MAEKLEENNVLIAEFMGWKYGDTYAGKRWTSGEHSYPYTTCGLAFHLRWNWLMPVYKKINDAIDEIGLTNESGHQIAMQDALLEADLEGVWTNAVALIKEIPLTA